MKAVSIIIRLLEDLAASLLHLKYRIHHWQQQHCRHRKQITIRKANGAWSSADVTSCRLCGVELSRNED
ncbi:MAG: hypothetical protein PHW95_02745 [Patescibacteria group bacterium]|nr:hypothetical protein [Patescibacteria group bacterium]